LKSFFDPSSSLLDPAKAVLTFTKSKAEELALPSRAVIVVDGGNLDFLVRQTNAARMSAWKPYRTVFRIPERETVLIRSAMGGPNIAALVEEIASFGVNEVCFWGYCGGIGENLAVGDKVLVNRALREEGTSHHYVADGEEYVGSEWFSWWQPICKTEGFVEGTIWSCDAPYRETKEKVKKYRSLGILGVEMEVASLYAVCAYRNLNSIAFLVVSDLVHQDGWNPGFFSSPFKAGVREMAGFVLNNVV
jgi:uridine phosphorylase